MALELKNEWCGLRAVRSSLFYTVLKLLRIGQCREERTRRDKKRMNYAESEGSKIRKKKKR